jgi:hypothetical protein
LLLLMVGPAAGAGAWEPHGLPKLSACWLM